MRQPKTIVRARWPWGGYNAAAKIWGRGGEALGGKGVPSTEEICGTDRRSVLLMLRFGGLEGNVGGMTAWGRRVLVRRCMLGMRDED